MSINRLIEIMGTFIQDAGKKVFLVLDSLRIHHAALVAEWLAERTAQTEVFYLPPYFPEINFNEYLSRDLKTQLRTFAKSATRRI